MVAVLTLVGAASVAAVVTVALFEIRRSRSRRQQIGAVALAGGYSIGTVLVLANSEGLLADRAVQALGIAALALLGVGSYAYQIDRNE